MAEQSIPSKSVPEPKPSNIKADKEASKQVSTKCKREVEDDEFDKDSLKPSSISSLSDEEANQPGRSRPSEL